jgi:hypothetical protein
MGSPMAMISGCMKWLFPENGASGRDPALRGAFVSAHIPVSMLRFPKGRAPWLTA